MTSIFCSIEKMFTCVVNLRLLTIVTFIEYFHQAVTVSGYDQVHTTGQYGPVV